MPVGLVERDLRGRDGPAAAAGVQHVGQQILLDEQFTRPHPSALPLVGERHVHQTGELVGRIPFALAVPHQNQGAVAHAMSFPHRRAPCPDSARPSPVSATLEHTVSHLDETKRRVLRFPTTTVVAR